jgi:hypothetical protein
LVVYGGTPFSAPQTSPYVAPYAVTDADGFCTLSPAAYTALGANWTVTAKGTGTPCNLVITDANGTTQSATVNVTGISGPQHLITVSSLRNACMSGSGYESTANQCYLEYGSSSAAQGTDSFVLTESNPPDGSGNFSIVPTSGNCSAIAPTFSALYGPGTLSGFDVTYGTGSFYGSCVISITDNYLNTATVTIYVDQTNLTVQGKSRRK